MKCNMAVQTEAHCKTYEIGPHMKVALGPDLEKSGLCCQTVHKKQIMSQFGIKKDWATFSLHCELKSESECMKQQLRHPF